MTADESGLFGPDSVTWRVHADPVLWVAGVRALLLQALHPVAMSAVHQFSDFRDDPWGRFMRTADFVGVTTYGTVAEARAAGARVRSIHQRLSGVDPVTGRAYRVDDPDLLLWIHCCELDSFLSTVRRSGARLSERDSERYVAEQVRNARLVGLTADQVPTTVAALTDYFVDVRPRLQCTPTAREAMRFLAVPPMPAWVQLATPARVGWASITGLATALLPRWARRMYGFPGLPTTDLGATLALRSLRAALLAVPESLREGPRVKAAKARLAC